MLGVIAFCFGRLGAAFGMAGAQPSTGIVADASTAGQPIGLLLALTKAS